MVCQLIVHSNVIVGITISRGSFVFSQSRVKVSASLANVRHWAKDKIQKSLAKELDRFEKPETKDRALSFRK